MTINLLGSPSYFSIYSFLKLSSINLKPLYSYYKGENKYIPFQKTNKSIQK